MKDIYELLNDIEIDESEFEEMSVNDIERAKVKKTLKNSIKRKNNWKKKGIAVASAGIITTSVLGMAFPSYAKDIPIVRDIFAVLDIFETGVYKDYKKNSNDIDVTKVSNGISITINDAIFDGSTIIYTYTIESDRDLGDKPNVSDDVSIKGNFTSGMTGNSICEKVDENTYIGQSVRTISDFVKDKKDSIDFKINIDRLASFGSSPEEYKEEKGKWKFNISLDAVKGNTQVVNQSVEKEGIEAIIEEININPMSMNIVYTQKDSEEVMNKWDRTDISVDIRDDLGNVYQGEDNGGSGNTKGVMTWSKTFEKLKDGATKLIITPKATLSMNTKDNSGGVMFDEDGNEIDITSDRTGEGERKEIVFDEIIIELNK
ncbi:DUF4179 domain-containing protein [Romboutsia weinsteinii]|uniref:DUF4179 domain-containing protein n=1 Tax=Romboutsia weinsteinii TaxID=2020949 RepID=A0A371J3M8_9FIRM|nr:DUF4179 domain-containing protein [Romboutsia weinsteinii]RDY27278.1 DUF4179 domain-containing protein [Romboutsia weinsteinii]